MFPIDSAHRQLGRLRKLRIPDFVGFSATSLVIGIRAGNGQTYLDMIGQSIDMDKEVKPNPNSSYKHSRKGKRACRELLPSLFKYKTARLMTH